MFLYESLPWYTVLMGFAVLAGLMLINELARVSKWIGLGIFFVLPIFLTFWVWPKTAAPGTSVGTWFHYAKVYSVLIITLIIMGIRYIKSWANNKYILALPALLLAINILEAVIRDFQCYSYNGFVDGVMITGGSWNIMNGIAGILNILAISGWTGIIVSKRRKKDMIWPDQLWFWIIPYDLWNFAYVYNCIGDHSFYAGIILLLSCTIPAFFIKKGAWLQHRAHTLAIWVMFAMTFPQFIDTSKFAVKASQNTTALFIVSLIALLSNIALIVYHVYMVVKTKRNPFKEEIYSDLECYKEVKEANA
ncbi:DUF5692 family protein [Tenuifilum thalassicum]|uniref:Uncharacterized protein n=1 Tax=Tenuifilum thalassicum TaxID=2590900 RepID=A0A7D4BCX2_9BACT|nr:DUF5692 family protein [Tenuifilum thalassicum]QKG79143.1 hypothetical protein FHG85_02315 [Tenuifilum thalassicum]